MWYLILAACVIGLLFLTFALCKASGEADDAAEKMMADIRESNGEN